MKKILILSSLCILASILLSSCGTHLSMTKRHYNKGYYVSNTNNRRAISQPQEKRAISGNTTPSYYLTPVVADESDLNAYQPKSLATGQGSFTASTKKIQHSAVQNKNIQRISPKKMLLSKQATIQNGYDTLKAKKIVSDGERNGLSLFWLIILVILILWAVGFLAGGFGLGGLINLLLLVALILLILWLLRIV